MKKKIVPLIILAILTSLGIIVILNNKNKSYEIKGTNNGQFAFFYQDEKGEYQKSTDSKWDSGEYVLNIANSSCDGENNPKFLSWNEDNNSVILTRNKATKCSLYFDVKHNLNILKNADPGLGELLKHTSSLLDSAEDNGYRYSGDDPNNFICFGSGSEEYNRGEESTCDIKNKYRIIGYVPVVVNEKQVFRLKVIKAEYLTDNEFVQRNGTAGAKSDYEDLKRIESSQSGIAGYALNTNADNTWENTTLYKNLNSEDYLNKAFAGIWQDKIETVTWNVGGYDKRNLKAKAMYDVEINGQVKDVTVDAMIGLMYVHDYGFASSKNNWKFTIDRYCNLDSGGDNRENNWLFNGVYEWIMLHNSSSSDLAFNIYNTGEIFHNNKVTYSNLGVRPVFYLKQDVELISNETALGTKEKPFKIVIPDKSQLDVMLDTDVGDGELIHNS